jgi:hypothetical protein
MTNAIVPPAVAGALEIADAGSTLDRGHRAARHQDELHWTTSGRWGFVSSSPYVAWVLP